MAWRFKASKYKNTMPSVPKVDTCIRDVLVGSNQTYGNNITASAAFVAFNWDQAGTSVAVLPLDDNGRKSKTMPLVQAHGDTVTYLDFSPFHDGLLASGSLDCNVKLWHIPDKGLEQSISTPECAFQTSMRRVETVSFHPTAECLLTATAMGSVYLWDLTNQQQVFYNNDHPDTIQGLSWKGDGRLCATNCKDKMVRVMDPRAPSPITMVADSHQGTIDSRIVWLGEQNRVLTTGFDASRLRQVIVRDLRNFGTPEKTIDQDSSTGILMPLFDPDTKMLFLAGKGDTSILFWEVTENEPYMVEGFTHIGEQTRGACLVPKRVMRVMQGEVNRVMQLTANAIIPVQFQVPRKTYLDFHGDLYPDTPGCRTELTATQWINGANTPVPKISLDPAKRELGEAPIIILKGPLKELVKNIANTAARKPAAVQKPAVVQKPRKKEELPKTEMQPNSDRCELVEKFREARTILKQLRCYDESLPMDDNGNGTSKPSSFDSEPEKAGEMTSPKPLPRRMSGEETANVGSTAVTTFAASPVNSKDNRPRPAPRPRPTGNKPRLGPKPFSQFTSDEFSFKKVFKVPLAPGNQPTKQDVVALPNNDNGANDNGNQSEEPVAPEEQEQDQEDYDPADTTLVPVEECEPMEQGQGGDSAQSLNASTAERVKPGENEKMFERYASSESIDKFEANASETDGQFQRMGVGLSTMAERRRMFESRSQSVQDEKASPIPLRRRQTTFTQGEQKASDDTVIKAPQADMGNYFLRNRSDLSKKNMPPATVKRSNSNSSGTDGITATPPTENNSQPNAASKRTSTVFGRVSKFRHLQGTAGHKCTHIENIRNLSRQVQGDCDGFQANAERVAVPIAGAGGKIAVFELSNRGRQPDGVIPTLLSGQKIMDFQWDPFEPSRLAVACDDGTVKLWNIPKGGLIVPTNEPAATLTAHADKIYIIRYHPLARDVLLTASCDMKVWDLATMTERYCLLGHTDQIFAFAWSPCGRLGATICKDGRIRVYEPRRSENPIREGSGPVGNRGARIVWALEGEYLVLTGFDKVSERQIYVYKLTDLNTPMGMVGLDVSPAILMPFYDEDSSTLFATGRGDNTIYCFEITDEAPFICPLSHHRCPTMTQGLSFLAKNQCDVASVEFAKAFRLTKNSVEPLSFTVPRIRSELFQDDLFPETKVLWQPTLSADAWFAGSDVLPARLNLQPAGMEKLSSIQHNIITQLKQKESIVIPTKAAELVNEQIKNAVSARMSVNTTLEQDGMEGVDEKEWEE